MKKLTLKVALSAAIMLFGFSDSNAQNEENKWSIGVRGGINQYNGDLGSGFFNYNQELYGFGGISVGRYLGTHWDVVADAGFGEVGHDENDGSNNGGANAQAGSNFRARMIDVNAYARFNFFKYDDVKVRPFLLLGVGYLQFNDLNDQGSEYVENMSLPTFGAGFKWKISPQWSFLYQNTMIWSDYDKIDGANNQTSSANPEWNENDLYLKTMIGLSYNLGKEGDDDGDGVNNSDDDCPNVAGVPALNGCPDADGDGITDKEDKCPNTYGIKAFMGCPDSDSDGIADADDACPNMAGPKELNGCPDGDGDGVADKADACPEVAGLTELAGCPDSDGDGIADKDDACPNKKGTAANQGCPDTDGDGVADNKDLCPDVAGLKENKGCPAVKKAELKVLKEALYGVKFQSGKAVITPNSYTILENVYAIMENTPQYKLQIHGHTDSDGTDALNMKLSKDRAAAVKNFLVKKGIDTKRLSSEGFGESKPVATNSTRAGKAQNRRVELEIKF